MIKEEEEEKKEEKNKGNIYEKMIPFSRVKDSFYLNNKKKLQFQIRFST